MRFSEFLKQHSQRDDEADGFIISESDIEKYWPATLAEDNVLHLLDGIKQSITNGIKSGVKLEVQKKGSGVNVECSIDRAKYKTTEALEEATTIFESIKHLACLMTYSKIYEEAYRQEIEKDHYGKDAGEIVLKHVEPTNINNVSVMNDLSDKFKSDRNKKVASQFRYCVNSYCDQYKDRNEIISWFTDVVTSLHEFFQTGYMEIRAKVRKAAGVDDEKAE